jgi:hypothetical protein
MDFIQPAPTAPNTSIDDRGVQRSLAPAQPNAERLAISVDLDALGPRATPAWRTVCDNPRAVPTLSQRRAWGERIDHRDATPAWQRSRAMAARLGRISAVDEGTREEHARFGPLLRLSRRHIAGESFAVPLAMNDGAATALEASARRALTERRVTRRSRRQRQGLADTDAGDVTDDERSILDGVCADNVALRTRKNP